MTTEIFGQLYTILSPRLLWLFLLLPLLWLPLRGHARRGVLAAATLLRTVAASLIIMALAGLSHQTILSDQKLAVVAAVDTSDSIASEARTWMQTYLEQLKEALSPEDELSILSFATDTQLVLAPGPATQAILPESLPAPDHATSTNIVQALERSFALYPEGTEKRLLLLTDGNETTGRARQAVATARQMGIAIYPVIPPGGQKAEVSLEKFVVPPLTREGSVFDMRLVVRNGHARPVPGRADIFVDDHLLTRQAVSLEPGLSVLEIPAQILQRGNYLLRAEIQTDADTIAGNNTQSTSLAVAGKTRALVITNNPQTHLARALQIKEVEIEFRRPEGLPTTLPDLLDYNSVVFDDISREEVTKKQMAVIERYVRDFGGGFLMTGGTRTFGTLDYQHSAIERLLPVSFCKQRPQKKKRIPIALFLLIDRSNSMGYNSRVRGLHDGQKMEYAQKAATAVLGQLENTDLAGAIAFDSEAYALSALQRLAKNRSTLRSRIGRLRYGGGTDFHQALEAAADQLSRSRRSIRHIILLTDGDTNRSPADHYPLIKTIAQRQISITTIRIGTDTVNLQLLSYMSEKTGGRFYHVEDATMLPQLLVRDTRRTLRQQNQEDEGPKDIVPHVGVRGQILRGLSDFPALDEYMLTTPKKQANVQLYTDVHGEQDPLLATWQYGLGKVVAVPFDPSGAGSGDWIRWERFGKFWSQAVRWAMRNETPLDYRLSATKRGERTILRVESFDTTEGGILQARLASGTRSETLTLMPVAPRISEAILPARYTGNVPVTIIKRKGNTILNQRSQTVLVGQEVDGALKEYRQQQPNRPLLHALAEGTGGSLNPTFDELTSQIRGGQKVLLHPLENTLIVIALFLILADIALRVLFGPLPETSPL